MTIIEFFDAEMLENILGTLMYQPKRTVLFGKDAKKMSAFIRRTEPILKRNGITTELVSVCVNTNDYFAVTEMLRSLAETYNDCVFDLLGGEETVLVAMGAVANEKNIPMCSVNPRSGRAKKVFPAGGMEKELLKASLSCADAISLFGGTLVEYTPLYNEKSDEDALLSLWRICKKDCGKWNTAIEQLASFIPSKEENPNFDGVTVSIPNHRLEAGLRQDSYRMKNMYAVLSDICSSGLAREKNNGACSIFTFRSAEILSMLEKSGNVLELCTLHAVASCKTIEGARALCCAVSGAVINWENPPDCNEDNDVKNEIDVLATVGAIPVFISCKNGCVDSNELYKLNTVARRFGGKYAKKLLVMTYFNPPDSFIQRAQAMNIRLIRNVQELSYEAFKKKVEDYLK